LEQFKKLMIESVERHVIRVPKSGTRSTKFSIKRASSHAEGANRTTAARASHRALAQRCETKIKLDYSTNTVE
jgi:hypothetical protein